MQRKQAFMMHQTQERHRIQPLKRNGKSPAAILTMKSIFQCQNLRENGHSSPIKDFWGVVVECKVMPRACNNRTYQTYQVPGA